MRPEQSVFLKVKKILVARQKMGEPLWWFRTHGGGRTKIGLPDLCLVYYGRSIWIELKKAGGKASKIQLRRIKEIQAAGGVAAVADQVATVEGILAGVRLQAAGVSYRIVRNLPASPQPG